LTSQSAYSARRGKSGGLVTRDNVAKDTIVTHKDRLLRTYWINAVAPDASASAQGLQNPICLSSSAAFGFAPSQLPASGLEKRGGTEHRTTSREASLATK
jgi:hypothetical protein